MVEPSVTDEDRARFSRQLKAGFVLLVGASGGLVSLQVDPSPLQVAGAVAGGLVVGALLVWYLAYILPAAE